MKYRKMKAVPLAFLGCGPVSFNSLQLFSVAEVGAAHFEVFFCRFWKDSVKNEIPKMS